MAVTGAGIVTALGAGWRANADGFREGRTAFRPVTLFDVSRQRAQLAAEADLPEDIPAGGLTPRQRARLDRASKLFILAGAEALAQAGWDDGMKNGPALSIGTSAGGMSMGEAFHRQAGEAPARRAGQATRIVGYQPRQQAVNLCNALGVSGPCRIIANACASGTNAVGHAWQLVRSGRAERAVAGGYDALSQLVYAGFDSLQALSAGVPRPFDKDRDGLGLGEGAAVLTLEPLEAALARGADVLAEIAGYGAVNDAFHLTQPNPEGDAALQSMTQACEAANWKAGDVDYVNAHGTGTPLNDKAEAQAIRRLAGKSSPDLKVSSTKASIGHLLGAAGAVEAVICLMVLREKWLPPGRTVENPDPLCAFDLVTEPRDAPVRRVLTNSFGFGGANATLALQTAP